MTATIPVPIPLENAAEKYHGNIPERSLEKTDGP